MAEGVDVVIAAWLLVTILVWFLYVIISSRFAAGGADASRSSYDVSRNRNAVLSRASGGAMAGLVPETPSPTMSGFLVGVRGLVKSPWDVTTDDFDLVFIARGLSRIGRYLGSGAHYYSVAEHCVELSHRVPEEYALEALLHDATEAFVGDMHSRIKELLLAENCEAYHYLEMHFWHLICDKWELDYELPAVVDKADKDIRRLEKESLFCGGPYQLRGFPPQQAERLFMRRAIELVSERIIKNRRAALDTEAATG